jgi:peptidyl-prolyl cis-trans isomerase D
MFSRFNSGLVAAFVIGIVVISFMFSGYDTNLRKSTNDAASVGPYSISIRAYQNEYGRQINFFTQLTGGQPLSSKQIEQFNIRKNALNSLINQKLILILSNKLGVGPTDEEIRQEIKNLPYFKVNEQFDMALYKNLLSKNNTTPAEFETEIKEQIAFRKTQQLIQTLPSSRPFKNDLKAFNDQKAKIDFVQFTSSSLQKFIKISPEELNKFLADQVNTEKVKAVFTERKPQLDQPEKIKVRHILLLANQQNEAEVRKKIEDLAKKITPQNFGQMAGLHSEDPETKDKGGDLGTITKGLMVPEFDDVAFSSSPNTVSPPVKTEYGWHLILVEAKLPSYQAQFDEYKNKLAIEMLQHQKIDQEKQLAKDLTQQVEKLLAQNNTKELKKLQEEYRFTYYPDRLVGRLTGIPQIQLKEDQLDKLFKSTNSEVLTFSELNNISIVKISPATEKDKKEEVKEDANPTLAENDNSNRMLYLSQKLREDLIQNLQKQYKTKLHVNLGQD